MPIRLAFAVFVALFVATLAPPVLADDPAPAPPRAEPEPFRWVNPPPKGKFPHVVHATYDSKVQGTKVGYNVLLPPRYEDASNADRRYPVVYYLHGGRPGGESKSVALSDRFFEAMKTGGVPPMIYVFVNGGRVSHYDYPQLKSWGMKTFHEELIPHVDATYRTIAKREARGVEGFSQGGRGAARHVFARPDLFVSAAPMGGGHQHELRISQNDGDEGSYQFALGDNAYDLAREYAQTKRPAVNVLLAFGTRDFNHEANLAYAAHLESLGIPFEKHVVEDAPHSAAKVYDGLGTLPMKWHAANFERALGEKW
jgi:enterochelin esterase-like enzyme